jgi:hypothetical protein
MPNEIDTFNRFFVGIAPNNCVTVMKPVHGLLSRDEALTLAAWLVTIAALDANDPAAEFAPYLEAVQNA